MITVGLADGQAWEKDMIKYDNTSSLDYKAEYDRLLIENESLEAQINNLNQALINLALKIN